MVRGRDGRSVLGTAFLVLIVSGAPVLAADTPSTLPGSTVVARIGDEVITVDEVKTEMARRGMTGELASPRHRQALLDDMIRLEVLAAAGRAAGYANDPAIVLAVKRLLADKVVREQLTPSAEALKVTDADAGRYYEQHAADYAAAEKRRVAVIYFRVPASADADAKRRVRLRAEQVLADATKLPPSAEGFGPLAARHSEDAATRYQGGDAGWLEKGGDDRFGPAVRDAAFRLTAPAQLAPVVETKDGLYLVKLLGIEKSGSVPLATAKATIARRLSQERAERLAREAYEKLRAAAAVKVDAAALGSITPPPGGTDPSGPPELP